MLEEDAVELVIGNFPSMPPHMHDELLFREDFLCAGRAGNPGLAQKLTLKRYA